MTKLPVRKFFYGLNIQFIVYFLLFSYVPLLIFSIIGYFLNKNIIQTVHEKNLNEVSGLAISRLHDYFDSVEENLRQVFYFSDIRSPRQSRIFLTRLSRWDSTAALAFFHKNKLIGTLNVPGHVFNQIKQLNESCRLCYDGDEGNFFLFVQLPEGYWAWVKLPYARVKERLRSLNAQVEFRLVHRTNGETVEFYWPGQQPPERNFRSALLELFVQNPPYIETTMSITHNWQLVTRKSKYLVFRGLLHFLQRIFLADLIIGILLLVVAVLLSRRITEPIHDLIKAAHKISEGELQQPVNVKARDEIKILADEFEIMRQKLLESYTSLESKIEQRTRELKEAQFQISHQEKMASLGLMAAGVAHEIGNPLTSISSMAQIIKRKVDNPQIGEYISTILKNIERISKIVRELVDFSRPSSYEAAMVDINEIIRNAVNMVKYDRRAKQIELEMELADDLPAIYLVEDQMLQVFINILINAVDAIGDKKGRIRIQSRHRDGRVYIHFEDNGAGIAEEHLNKIFEPFFTTKQVGKGTGLGLSVSYGIIRNFNGEIKVQSKVNKGSKFTIEIPVDQKEAGHDG
ncbi:MAG TPA: HAMP domain-containing sensor histidine kinase [Caldithrix abyssi]|uniref:histidine kinase n=1 Tax=Caldithrix abyssi TaxID=187145 RepID=A0A7V5PNA8_CALAY|nr:HAMP domain-containing sensor histidine kinase [Caldithrix abyssi]